jgi:hypothetical protein
MCYFVLSDFLSHTQPMNAYTPTVYIDTYLLHNIILLYCIYYAIGPIGTRHAHCGSNKGALRRALGCL